MDLGTLLMQWFARMQPGFQAPADRFNYTVLPSLPGVGAAPEGSRWILEPSGNVSESRLDATPWVDIPYSTQARDLWALTIGGRGGTSEGDAWEDPEVAAARKIVGSDISILPRHVRAYKQRLLDLRAPHFMSIHPEKEAY
jgi:hypothetical protein